MHSHPSQKPLTEEQLAALPKIRVDCGAFRRNPDGSWTSTRVTDIQTPETSVRVNPGILFRKGRILWGLNVADILDEHCSQ